MKKLKNMVYRRFHGAIITLAILLALVSYAFGWSVNQDYKLVTSVSLGLLWFSLIAYIIYHMNRTNRDLERFIMSFHFNDMSNLFDTEKAHRSDKKLYAAFNRVILAFRELRSQKEQEHLLFRSTVEQTGAGIVVLDQSGKVEISNQAFHNLFGIKSISHIDQLKELHPVAHKTLSNIKPGKQELLKILITEPKAFVPDDKKQTILNSGEMIMDDRKLKVVTLQNIQHEIEQQEIDAWERLLRIMNHEIMNSVSPINLLTASLIQLFQKNGKPIEPGDVDKEKIESTLLGLETIQKRGKGLMDFVESYRAIARLPEPVLKDLQARVLFRGITHLLKADLEGKGVGVEISVIPENLIIRADETLLEQTLINLVKNAVDAIKDQDDKKIRLEAFLHDNRPVLSISDNGPGIASDVMENIFTPFFTSRKGGSGIGLSFARQVMKMHHGNIGVNSMPGTGSTFTLSF
jgi:nitrogen fixation/metabolism regulation signal transduction histidine kinase